MTSQGTTFAGRLNARIIATQTPLCIGLDPFSNLLPSIFGSPTTIAAWEGFFGAIIDLIGDKVAAFKPQLGLFEPFGAQGIDLVSRLSLRAKNSGALVILDAKRGDIGSTAGGYADAYLGPNPVIDCDCITLNPYLGIETLEPFIVHAENLGKGICVLVRTSNQGAKDFQDLDCGGEPLWVKVAQALKPVEALLTKDGSSSLMVVIGATWPKEAQKLRTILTNSQFLIPGYGAQGGSAIDALAGFTNKGNRLEGGLVSSSRAILYPKGAFEAQDFKQWENAINNALTGAINDLGAASQIVIAGV